MVHGRWEFRSGVLIPGLEGDVERIAAVLGDHEREDLFRLKHLKGTRSGSRS